jgi:hypothetical protein
VDTKPDSDTWQQAVSRLLAQAAAIAVENGADVDAFMRGAWSSYVEARPGFLEWLQEMHLRAHLEAMRQAGGLPSA